MVMKNGTVDTLVRDAEIKKCPGDVHVKPVLNNAVLVDDETEKYYRPGICAHCNSQIKVYVPKSEAQEYFRKLHEIVYGRKP